MNISFNSIFSLNHIVIAFSGILFRETAKFFKLIYNDSIFRDDFVFLRTGTFFFKQLFGLCTSLCKVLTLFLFKNFLNLLNEVIQIASGFRILYCLIKQNHSIQLSRNFNLGCIGLVLTVWLLSNLGKDIKHFRSYL